MKIEHVSVGLTASHQKTSERTVQETLRAWVGDRRPDFGTHETGAAAGSAGARAVSQAGAVAISEAARQAAAAGPPPDAPDGLTGTAVIDEAISDIESDPQMKFLIRLIEALTGRKLRLLRPGEFSQPPAAVAAAAPAGQDVAPPQGWGMEYDRHETVRESEQTRFHAEGVVRTADGQELRFSVSLQMSREFSSQTSVSVRAGDAVRKDPLVINFGGTAAELTGRKFDFDVDADGLADRISFVTSASGFLALDRNGNGAVDDGTELFGALTGNGFAELAAYDEDGNGWIDENDAVYARLLVWSKDAEGKDVLATLAERKVGALYLGFASTPFDLNDAANRQHGQIRSSGVWLGEQGGAGTLQQIDLFV